MGGPGAEEDEEIRLARAIAESKAQASKRTATIFAPSDLPDYQPRPEVNWGERWELEEALATVPASQGGAAAAAAMGMAHPEIEGSSLAGTGIARRAIPEALPAAELDPAERGFHADDATGSPADDADDRPVWVKTYDPNEDDFYFYNPETRETTWEEPDQSAAKIMLHHAIEGNARARRKLGLDPPGGPDDGGDAGDDGGAHPGADGADGADGYGRATVAEMLDDVKVYEYEDVRAVWNGMPTETEEERASREEAEAASRAKDPLGTTGGGDAKQSKRAARKRADEMQERLWRLQDERQRREDAAAGVAGIVYEGTAGLWAAKAAEARAAAVAAAANDDDDGGGGSAAEVGAGSGAGAAVSEWAVAAMEGLAAAEAGRAPAAPAAPASSSRKEWYYRDDGGVWQGPWSVDELRGWRSMLPMELAVRRGPVDAGDDQNQNDQSQSLASVLGDDELLARAAAMDVHLPPRATATQAEIAIETVIAMRAGKAGRGDDDDAAAAGDQDRKQPPRDSSAAAAPAGMSAPPPPRAAAGVASSMVDSVLAGLNPEQYRAVVSGGVDPADMARALVAKTERDRVAAAEAAKAGVGDHWTSSGYATEARYNKMTGRVTAAPAGSFATGGGASIYSGGALDHHIDVNKLEEGLWEMKRAKERRKERALSKQEIDRLKKRRAEIKKKHYVAPWDVGFENVQD